MNPEIEQKAAKSKKGLYIVGGLIGVALLMAGLGNAGKSTTTPTPSVAPAEVKADSTKAPEPSFPAESIVNQEELESPKATATPKPTVKPTSTPKASVAPKASVQTVTSGGSSTGSTSGGDKDCADFQTQAEAQAYFNSKGGSASNNVDRLDGNDHDGRVCESLP